MDLQAVPMWIVVPYLVWGVLSVIIAATGVKTAKGPYPVATAIQGLWMIFTMLYILWA